MLLSNLNPAGSAFITITGAGEDPAWYASVTLPGYGTFEVERNGTCHGGHDQRIQTGPGDIARSLILPSRRGLPWPTRQKINPDI